MTYLQFTDTVSTETAIRFGIVLGLGAMWGAYGYLNNVRHGVPGKTSIDPMILAKTMALGALAGAVVGLRGDEVTFDAVDAVLVVLIPIVDDFLNDRLGWTQPTAKTDAP